MTTAPAKPQPSLATPSPNSGPSALMLLLTRMAVPMWLAILAAVQIAGGLKTLPSWMPAFAQQFHLPFNAALALRVIIGAELAGMCTTLLLGRLARPASVLMLAAICFSTVAEVSRVGLGLDSMWSAGVFLVSLLLLAPIVLREEAARPPRATWPALMSTTAGVVAAVTVAAMVRFDMTPPTTIGDGAGGVTLGPPTDPFAGKAPGERIRQTEAGALPSYYFMEEDAWVGMQVTQADWAAFLPDDAVAKLKQGTHILVFYSPNKPPSHQLFDDILLGVDRSTIMAIRIPPSPRAPQADAGLGPVHCDGCEMIGLPYGPMWFFPVSPSIMKVVDGKIVCYAKGVEEMQIQGCVINNVSPAPDLGPGATEGGAPAPDGGE